MNKNLFGVIIILVGGMWIVASLFADELGLGSLLFGFSPGSAIGRIQLVFIGVGVFIFIIGVAALVLVKDKAE